MAALARTHLVAKIGEDHFYPDIKAAIHAIHGQTHQGGEEKACPLISVVTAADANTGKEG